MAHSLRCDDGLVEIHSINTLLKGAGYFADRLREHEALNPEDPISEMNHSLISLLIRITYWLAGPRIKCRLYLVVFHKRPVVRALQADDVFLYRVVPRARATA